jgi:glyoxalase/bleomycin resistance protein/dioxygenase superfamily protein
MAQGQVTDLIPFVHVADISRSIAFYELLGFTLGDTHLHHGQLDWAALENGDAQIMLARASAPVDPSQQAVLFYLYSPDLAGLREHLAANGVHAGPIRDGTPGPTQEMGLSDPDGYCLMVAQIED